MARNSSRSPYSRRLNMDTSDMFVDQQLSMYENDDNACAMSPCPVTGGTASASTDPMALLPLESSPRRFHMFGSDELLDDLGFNAHGGHRKRGNHTAVNPPKPLRNFHSLSSGLGSTENSLDDEYMQEYFNLETQEPPPSTSGIGTLLRAQIKNVASFAAPLNSGPEALPHIFATPKRASSPTGIRRCKSPLSDAMHCSPKRFRGAEYDKANRNGSFGGIAFNSAACPVIIGGSGRPPLRKTMSLNDAQIMSALTRSESVDMPDLIGDFSKPYALPLLKGRHSDLKSISSDTLARLLRGNFVASVDLYAIIDCRYPYEYEGGHIMGAKNLYTQPQIVDEFLVAPPHSSNGGEHRAPLRFIVIFHCEFSSERGPKLLRFLRNKDRARNTSAYPALDYPELYLLHNGYKEFYETHGELCVPRAYRPMLTPAYNESYRHFRAKSKSWNADAASQPNGGVATTTTTKSTPKSRSLFK